MGIVIVMVISFVILMLTTVLIVSLPVALAVPPVHPGHILKNLEIIPVDPIVIGTDVIRRRRAGVTFF